MNLLSPNYIPLVVTKDDLSLASICWGFTLGFGFLTAWKAASQTMRARSPMQSVYIWMIWLELLVCLAFSIMCWMYLYGALQPSFAFYFIILTTWALQVQILLQIIINRISVIVIHRDHAARIKWGVAALITAVNISVYCIWIPARLQISERYIFINNIWDRCEKVIYLLVDGGLNWYFVRTVKYRLVNQGSTKYNRIVKFNVRIIFASLAMDCLIIGAMSINNSFVYMQFHPLAYTVKLMIEMTMADLIRTIASEKNEFKAAPKSIQLNVAASVHGHHHHDLELSRLAGHAGSDGVVVQKEVIVESRSVDQTSEASYSKDDVRQHQADDVPLRGVTWDSSTYGTGSNTTNITSN